MRKEPWMEMKKVYKMAYLSEITAVATTMTRVGRIPDVRLIEIRGRMNEANLSVNNTKNEKE